MIGPWSPTVRSTGIVVEAVATALATAIQHITATSTIRLAATTASERGVHFT